ncbi:hypothetical protein ACSVDE_11750 [Pseudalkalibacillus sp. Hm43]|uniref:hypothetical protein n=1 Tax=Pseudalkalibacillus sp. Hm43 TaxID=3450742 RepID=UPI003F43FE31
MQLFHYHWWTERPEEMEKFYERLGFETTLRVGRYNGEFQQFNPPLTWEDFRDKGIQFRIIEMVKGQTNITFGQGKRDMFDHIGVLVSDTEYKQIIDNATQLKWTVNEGERRTFVTTPWKFKIELQKRKEVVSEEKHTFIENMTIRLPFQNDPELIGRLLDLNKLQKTTDCVKVGNYSWNITFNKGNQTRLDSVVYLSNDSLDEEDPVGTKLRSRQY